MDLIVQEIVKKYWKELSKKQNVRYFSGTLKPKIIKGKEYPSIPCFRIYVTKKIKPLSKISPKDRIPSKLYLDGRKFGYQSKYFHVDTDVYPIGEIKALEVCRNRNRPIKAGCSAMNYLGTACTLGWFCKNKKKGEEEFVGIISNNHCTSRENKATRGEQYLYPSPYDGGTLSDTIGKLWRYVSISFNEFSCPYRNFFHRIKRLFFKSRTNRVDVGLVKIIIPLNEVSYEIFKIGKIEGKRRGDINELTKKTGRTTGLTVHGKLIDNDWYGKVQYSRGIAFFGPCGLIEGNKFSAGGDSSSAIIFEKDNKLAGLLFAGSESHTIFCHYDFIERDLEVEIL